ncbi:uncharacterized protein LOC127095271 [Lathyrus oleraceus]|uniref:uncharacterized protein LOC127095271 n=1 Tax=Pisum sativum TaxID=3888 RepID=UPI0021D014CC|nr:uncharacterized protein LOC127095271 [Pisum sativum]
MSKLSGLTPSKNTIDQSPPRIACANVDHSDVVTDVGPLSIVPRHVPTKRRARTPTVKKARPSTITKSSNPSRSVQTPSSKIRNIEPSVVVKKPHSMTILYLDPIKTTDVEPNVVPIVMGSVESTAKPGSGKTRSNSSVVSLDNPRSDNTLGQSGMNVTDKDIVDKIIRLIVSQILGIEPKSDVVPDVTTSLAQTDHLVETPLEKFDGKSNSEFVPIKSPEKSEENNDSDSMSIDMSDKEENYECSRNYASKKDVEKKGRANVPEVPIDNISFRYVKNVEKWKFVYQRRLVVERELGKDAFECKEVMGLIKEVGLMKSVDGFGKCYEMLAKEFIVNMSKDCDNKRSKEFIKVYARGRCVDFSIKIISRFMGRSEEEQAKVEVSDNIIYREIIAKQVNEWPRKGKLSAGCLSVKYVVLHRVGVANWVPTNHTSNIAIGLGHKKTLDETIKAYIEKKSRLEILINDLSKEDVKGNLDGDKEEYNEI